MTTAAGKIGADLNYLTGKHDMPVMMDQASQLRRIVRQRERATVIAVTSGKGGVGKSNIAVNLAIKLASAGRKSGCAARCRSRPIGQCADRAVQYRFAVESIARDFTQEGTGRRDGRCALADSS